jgi:hypothetical protein
VAAAAEIDEALRAVDERREQVRSDDVDRHHLRPGVDAGVVDHRVHVAQAVDGARDTAGLPEVGQVTDDDGRAEVADGFEPVAVAHVHDHLVPLGDQRLCGRASEAVCGAADEDACDRIYRSIIRWFASE